MSNRVCEILEIKYPIIQGAMAWISDGVLAASVSNAGGLGIIAGGNAPADLIYEEIKKAKELTDKPFGLNVMLLSPFVDDIVQLACEEKIKLVTTGAGNPSKYMEAFKANGIKVVPVVPSVAIAKKMEKLGADAVIAEGMESGGHIGKLTTMTLVPQVVDAVSIPVIGAGGIGDGRGMAAAFMLGAEAVQLGTRFLLAEECKVHENYKNLIIKAKDIDTTVTGTITGHPVRALRNKLTRSMEEYESCSKEEKDKNIELFEEAGRGALSKAVLEGDLENGSFMSGQIAGLVNKKQTSKEIVDELMEEFQGLMSKYTL